MSVRGIEDCPPHRVAFARRVVEGIEEWAAAGCPLPASEHIDGFHVEYVLDEGRPSAIVSRSWSYLHLVEDDDGGPGAYCWRDAFVTEEPDRFGDIVEEKMALIDRPARGDHGDSSG